MMANPEELIEKGHQLLKAIPASGLKTVIDLLELIVSQQKSQKELEDFLKNCPIEDEDISEEEYIGYNDQRRFDILDDFLNPFRTGER